MTILPKVIYRFKSIPIKLPMAFFTELEKEKKILYGNTKHPKQPKQYQERKMKSDESDSLISDYTTVIKIVWYKNRTIHQ